MTVSTTAEAPPRPLVRRTQTEFSGDGLSIEHRLYRNAIGDGELVVNLDDACAASASCMDLETLSRIHSTTSLERIREARTIPSCTASPASDGLPSIYTASQLARRGWLSGSRRHRRSGAGLSPRSAVIAITPDPPTSSREPRGQTYQMNPSPKPSIIACAIFACEMLYTPPF